MKYDLEGKMARLHRIAMENKAKREQKEKEDRENGVLTTSSSVPSIGSQEYIDKIDVPGAMDDGVALLLYIVVMVVGVIFNDRWIIWLIATILYLCHVFRRQIHKAKWEREHKQ